MSTSLGFIGLGRMGGAMALRLLECGHRVTAYNRSAGTAAAAALVERGGALCAQAADVAVAGGLVVSMLANDDAAEAVCADGSLLARLAGGTHLGMSTLSPTCAQRLAAAHTAAGVVYISAPVQGRPPMAGAGQLVAWLSGPPPNDAAQAVLADLCARQITLGADVGHACAAKLALNCLMFSNVALFAEALRYVENVGADPAAFTQGLLATAFPGRLFASITESLLTGDDAAAGSDLALCVKDLDALLADPSARQSDMPVARRVQALYRLALSHGLGAFDASAVRHVLGHAQALQ